MKQLAQETTEIDIHLTAKQLNQFDRYQLLLMKWNQRLNLTAIREPGQIQRLHFLDSLTCGLVTGNLNGLSLIDVGTGAGFPGIPLKILYPNLRLTLVESVAKKARFLEVIVNDLSLSDVAIIVERAEILGQDINYRAQYDWAVARAVARLPVLAEFLLPLCRIGGHMLAQKGTNAILETESAKTAIELIGGATPVLQPVHLPEQPEIRYLIVVKKVAVTPEKYPRRTGIPSKRPLTSPT